MADIFVSRLGDSTTGRSWATAFRSLQAALQAVPDNRGGHRVIVRPDTYVEANLWPAHPGAAGAYNQLVADVDGALGSGRRGQAVLDASDPGQGFKSYDWWGNLRSYQQGWSQAHTEQTFSAVGWDRWHLRHLYATGGDGGLFFDGTNRVEPFSVLVEDCVGIGRAFGGGVASVLSRADEPITFRRCHLWCLDWWGDAAGAYLRVENPAMPERPDVRFEDCTLVGPDNALKSGNPGFATYTRIGVDGCRLIALNFSQPHGQPGTGVIHSTMHGRYLHVDLADTTVMGYRVFGCGKAAPAGAETGAIGYTTRGSVRSYVQFQQATPAGFTRLSGWPAETFAHLAPPAPVDAGPVKLRRERVCENLCEVSPVLWQGRLTLLECHRPPTGGTATDYYLTLTDVASGRRLARFAEGYSLACAFVSGDRCTVYASRWMNGNWHDVTVFWSTDLVHWQQQIAITQEAEHLFNSTVCQGPDGYVMAYESDDPRWPPFTIKFARSTDLLTWHKVPDVVFGPDRYAACPCLRYAGGWYYLLYLEHRSPRWHFETWVARSRDLVHWELSVANPVLAPTGDDEGCNASDPDIIELDGRTYLYYCAADQLTWSNIKRAVYDGPLPQFFEAWFRPED